MLFRWIVVSCSNLFSAKICFSLSLIYKSLNLLTDVSAVKTWAAFCSGFFSSGTNSLSTFRSLWIRFGFLTSGCPRLFFAELSC